MTTTTRRALTAGLSAAALVAAALAVPATAAAAPSRATIEDDSFYAVVLPDPLVVTLLNTTRAQLCDGDPSGTGSVTVRLTDVLPDTTMVHQAGSVGAEVWELPADFTEADVPPFEAPEEICDDIATRPGSLRVTCASPTSTTVPATPAPTPVRAPTPSPP